MPNQQPRYLYQRRGGPLLSWVNGAPRAVRAGETRELGAFGDSDVFGQPRALPKPGAPEYISLGCAEAHEADANQGEYIVLARGPLHPRRDKVDLALDVANLALTGGALYVLYKMFKRSP